MIRVSSRTEKIYFQKNIFELYQIGSRRGIILERYRRNGSKWVFMKKIIGTPVYKVCVRGNRPKSRMYTGDAPFIIFTSYLIYIWSTDLSTRQKNQRQSAPGRARAKRGAEHLFYIHVSRRLTEGAGTAAS
jgi:hypothetical protein